jgi:hypothetical protein
VNVELDDLYLMYTRIYISGAAIVLLLSFAKCPASAASQSIFVAANSREREEDPIHLMRQCGMKTKFLIIFLSRNAVSRS